MRYVDDIGVSGGWRCRVGAHVDQLHESDTVIFGVNRRRVEAIRKYLLEKQQISP